MAKFHKREIKKGVYGELSKIEEELQEAYDAQEQGQDLMLLIELSDMIGAIEGVTKKHGFTIEQLLKFARLRSEVAIEELKEEITIDETLIYSVDQLIHKIWFNGKLPTNVWDQWEIIPGKYINQLEFVITNAFKMTNTETDFESFKNYLEPELEKIIRLKRSKL